MRGQVLFQLFKRLKDFVSTDQKQKSPEFFGVFPPKRFFGPIDSENLTGNISKKNY